VDECPLAEPQAPLKFVPETFALQASLCAPDPIPAQVHVHGPEPETEDVVPEMQRSFVGMLAKTLSSETPHCPFTMTPDLFA
jgi:hypothetical protein